jgi:hypothetical protein
MVWTGRMTVLISMIIAILFTWKDLLGIGGEGGFTFIQKYTGFISPVYLPCLYSASSGNVQPAQLHW